jgi:hypothetical protein
MDIFYKMTGLSIDGINVTPSNINNFKLHKRFESTIADIYSKSKNSKYGQFIIHIKNQEQYAKNNLFLLEQNKKYPEVDWFETSLKKNITYIQERL